MKNKPSQRVVLNLSFIFFLLIILMATFLSYRNIDKASSAVDWVKHTNQVMLSSNTMLLELSALEADVRAFLISGYPDVSNSIDEYVVKIKENFKIIKKLTSDNVEQQALLDKLEILLNKDISDFKEVIQEKLSNKISMNYIVNFMKENESLSDQIMDLYKKIYANESLLLEKRETNFIDSFNSTVLLTTSIYVVDIFLLLIALVFFNKILSVMNSSRLALEIQSKEINTINEMNNRLRSCFSLEETLTVITLFLKKLLPHNAGALYIMNHSKNFLESVSEWNSPENSEKIFSPSECWCLKEGKVYSYFGKEDNIPCKHFENEGSTTPPYFCVPLLAMNEILGVLHLQFFGLDRKVDSKSKRMIDEVNSLIQNLAGQVALAISTIKLQDVLKFRSTRDVLTQLYNRTYLEETFERDIQRAKRKKSPLCVVMMDLDNFKEINDRYGHEAGDSVLKDIANLLLTFFRKSDTCCRYGGEEILIIMYDTLVKDAVDRVEDLRDNISRLKYNFIDLVSVTASFGISKFPEDGKDSESLIRAADQALYQSKKNGRNQLTVFENLE